ncbi:MAG: amidohydrolase [Deltaproteobacteria bacterium]|nr:amidohydrolase [Deltaproteobacteria bacterium]
MYNGKKIIDVHGHMSTPPHFRAYAYNLIALRSPGEGELEISNELMETALKRHLQMLDERSIDVQMISARPIAMMHWERPFIVEKWTTTTNNIIHQQCKAHADRFVGIAQLPQSSTLGTENCIAELERCIKELGFVGAIVNPDPGADRRTPGMNTEYWFALYEKAQALNAPLIVHPSISRDPRIEIIPHSYQYNNLTEETLATLLLENSNVFELFPRLKIIICHCGGALSRFVTKGKRSGEGGGQVGMAIRRRTEGHGRDVSKNLFFDTCAYDKDFLVTAIRQRGVDRMLFGTEAPGTGTGIINPETGKPSDDIVPVIDSIDFLSAGDKLKIFNENIRKVFPLLNVD